MPFGAGSSELLLVARLKNGAVEKSSLKERLVAGNRHEAGWSKPVQTEVVLNYNGGSKQWMRNILVWCRFSGKKPIELSDSLF